MQKLRDCYIVKSLKQTLNFNILIICVAILTFSSCASDEEKAKEHLRAGIDLIEKHDLQGALLELDKAISYNSKTVEAYYYRANTHYNLHEIDLAMDDYDKVLELNPEHVNALTNRGNAKAFAGDRDGACKDWKKAEKLGKENLGHKTRFCK